MDRHAEPRDRFRCPKCRRPTPKMDNGLYFCTWCRCLFDDDPDEGGSYLNDPTRRIEREEEWRKSRKQKTWKKR